MRPLETILDTATRGRKIRIHLEGGGEYVGYVWNVGSSEVRIGNAEPDSPRSAKPHTLNLAKGTFLGAAVEGYSLPREKKPYGTHHNGEISSSESFNSPPERFSSPRPFSNSYDRELDEERESRERTLKAAIEKEEPDEYSRGLFRRDF